LTDSSSEPEALKALLEYLRRQRGVDFSAYKESSLHRRLEHRMVAIQSKSYSDYLDHLQATPEEMNALLDSLFINVTRFFRDREAWDVIASSVIPRILASNETGPLRVWCAGVASGEEAFTVAILLAEALGEEAFRTRVKIFATDADDGALNLGRAADYTPKQLDEVPDAYRNYFEQEADGRHIFRPDLRRSVIFGRHNLLEDAPISRLDLLICRNTLMYFNREAQGRILARFHFALKEEGALFLGKAETLLTRRHLFSPTDGKCRIFRKVKQPGVANRSIMLAASSADNSGRTGLPLDIRQAALESSPVAQVLVDADGLLAFANNAARLSFGLDPADTGRAFSELEISYRPVDVRSLIDHVKKDGVSITVPSIERVTATGRRFYDVSVAPLEDPATQTNAFSISFTDVTRAHDLQSQLQASKGELETAYEELQSTNEELETTNEELQSTIEELETTNEELQSTNEELETMNAELQSTNDEIRSINEQLVDRSAEVTRLNAYLRSIVDGQQAGVVVLDSDLSVSMWNREARELWGLNEDEVLRQPILNLDIGLPIHELRDPMRRVLRGDAASEAVTLPAHNRKGKSFDCHVQVAPLKGEAASNVGVILLMAPRADGQQGNHSE
jgi:two-component system CheB/CheR fusion protein